MSEIKRIKPSLPSGTRDFLPQEVAKRNYIFGVIKSVFEKYGFQQIETPVLENLATLTGKYGEEGDQLLFKVLNSGDYLKDANAETLQNKDSKKLTQQIADRGLRYDLTVPLARYVVQHQDDLVFPFKRYHIAPVWRADRPQKGRYREFYQCDADIIGSNSLLNEVELILIYDEVFKKLGLDVWIRINNRKLLEGLAQILKATSIEKFAVLIDKLDKLGIKKVSEELLANNVLEEIEIDEFNRLADEAEMYKGSRDIHFGVLEVIQSFRRKLEEDNIIKGVEGCDELLSIFKLLNIENRVDLHSVIEFDRFLARGLNYYTGTILEIISKVLPSIGSLGGGGRYGNLTEMFGGINMSGVGISFGIERIYDVMEELNLFPKAIDEGVQLLFVPRETALEDFTFSQVQKVREAGISAEIFLGNVKKQKQFSYAEQKNISYIVEVGENEQQSGLFRLRNAATREMENDLSIEKIIEKLQ